MALPVRPNYGLPGREPVWEFSRYCNRKHTSCLMSGISVNVSWRKLLSQHENLSTSKALGKISCVESSALADNHSKRSKLSEEELLRRMCQTISERHLFKPKQKILLAVSGGQDSVCLLHLMGKLSLSWDWVLGVLNCDHRWSNSSSQASSLVAQLAQSMNLNYYQAVTVSSVAGEGVARNWRYGVFQRIAATHGYDAIVTAHTASDRVETLLYNVFRGSGISGLQSLTWKRSLRVTPSLAWQSGFHSVDAIDSYEGSHSGSVNNSHPTDHVVELVRPLLGVTRSELRELHQQLGLPLWPDPSNHSLDIDRNRIRHELLPYLRKHFNPSIDKSLARWAEILHGEESYMEDLCQTLRSVGGIERAADEGVRTLEVAVVRALPVALQRRLLKQFCDDFTGRSVGFDTVERLRVAVGAKKSLRIYISGGCSVRIEDGRSVVLAREDSTKL